MLFQVRIDDVDFDFDGPMDRVSRRPSEAEEKRVYKRVKTKVFEVEATDDRYETIYDATCDFLEEKFGWMVYTLDYSLIQAPQAV